MPHDRAQRLDVEAGALGFRIDVADIVGDRLLLLLEPLDALDEGLQLVLGKAGRGLFLVQRQQRRSPSITPPHAQCCETRRFRSRRLQVKAARRSHPQQRTQPPPDDQCLWLAFSKAAFCSGDSPPSGASPSIPRTACRRPPRGSRPWSSARPWRRRRPSSSSTGSCGRSRRDSSGRCSARRCANADDRAGAGKRRLRVRCGSCRQSMMHRVLPIGLPASISAKIVMNRSLSSRRLQWPSRIGCHALKLNLQVPVTASPRAFLEGLFDTAVAAAHPATLPAGASAGAAGRRTAHPARGRQGRRLDDGSRRAALSRRSCACRRQRLAGLAVTRRGYARPTRHRADDRGRPSGSRRAPGLPAPSRRSRSPTSPGADDLVLVLMSGGASANWIAPAAGLSLDGEAGADARAAARPAPRSPR